MASALAPHPLQAGELAGLSREAYFVRRDWLEPAVSEGARLAMLSLSGFTPAGFGRSADRQRREEIRGDELCWLDPKALPEDLVPVLHAFEQMKDELNREAYLCLEHLELQGARYLRRGAGYQRHRDSFLGRPSRRLTCIYYLNERWIPEHGGCLRLHLSPLVVDIAPTLNSLVVFLSAEVEHEVLSSFQDRWALTAWWSGRA